MVGDMWWPECVQPPLPKERDKITFRRFLSYKNLPLKIYFLLVELALAERDFKNAGLSFLSIFFFCGP